LELAQHKDPIQQIKVYAYSFGQNKMNILSKPTSPGCLAGTPAKKQRGVQKPARWIAPFPDVLSQLLLALPLIVLFKTGMIVSRIVEKRYTRERFRG
jgi:hypothetical protein